MWLLPSHVSCPAIGQECYNCHGTGHFTALCRRPHPNRIQPTVSTGCQEITEAGPAAAGTQAGHPTKAGSLAEAFSETPTKASAPATAPPETAATEARGDHLTLE